MKIITKQSTIENAFLRDHGRIYSLEVTRSSNHLGLRNLRTTLLRIVIVPVVIAGVKPTTLGPAGAVLRV